MTAVPLYGSAINYGAALVVAAVVIGLTTRLALLFGRGHSIFRRH